MQKNISKREANKVQKREAFLDAAQKLFSEKGFENTSIDEVVGLAGLTKRTLYQYFQSKEDLFYAVALKGAQELYESSVAAIDQGENSREKIYLANLAHLHFYQKNLSAFKILNYIPANRENSEQSPYFHQIRELDLKRMMYVASLVKSGASDGSINPKLDIKKAVMFGFFSAFSLLYTFSFTDKGIWKALDLDENDFFQFSFELLSNALK